MLYKQKFIVGPQDVPEAKKDEPHPGWAIIRDTEEEEEEEEEEKEERGWGKFRKLLLSNGSEKFKAT